VLQQYTYHELVNLILWILFRRQESEDSIDIYKDVMMTLMERVNGTNGFNQDIVSLACDILIKNLTQNDGSVELAYLGID